jgi:hypothetical protein
MNIIASIRNFLIRGTKPAYSKHSLEKEDEQQNKPQSENMENSVKSESDLEFLDGMSTGTARFIIDWEVGADHLEKYGIRELENRERYYLAKIVNKDGQVTDTVLIDKLSRSIHFQKTKFR